MKSIILIVLLFIALFFIGCMDKIDKRDLIVFNKSKTSIYSIISSDNIMNSSSYYIEYRENEKKTYSKSDSIFKFVFEEIKPNSKIVSADRPKDWDSFFKTAKGNKLYLYIVSKDSIDKYGWYTIFKSKIYNKKYELTLEELEKKKWEIIYYD